MTYTAYTPGPWRLASECDPPDGYVWAPDYDELVAVAQYDCSDLPTITRAANARLIAAAPDLLAALEAMHACHRAFSSSESWTALDDEARLLAEKAITKAKGE